MGRSNTYRHYKLNAPTRLTLSVSSFKGVDYTPAQLDVAEYHAVDIKNLIWKDDVDQKRNGLEHCASVPIVRYYVWNYSTNSYQEKNNKNERQINGVYQFIAENAKTYTLVHAGKLLFLVTNFGDDYSFYNATWKLVADEVARSGEVYTVPVELENTISSAFIGSHRLYLLDGAKYRVVRVINGKLTVSNVEDNSLTYVPTTTVGIGISWKERTADGEYTDFSPAQPTPLDDVNLLTQWRKNKLVSGLFQETEYTVKSTHFFDYSLDTNIYPKKKTDLNDFTLQITKLVKGE